jgi:riboflavin transporter FmnP
MAYPTLDSYNLSNGMSELFVYTQDVVPFYADLLFGAIMLIFVLATYFFQEAKKGRGDFIVSFAVGSTVTTILAIIMGMIPNFVPFRTLGILIALTIISYFILFFSEER